METKEPQNPAELVSLLQELRQERERRKTEQKERGHTSESMNSRRDVGNLTTSLNKLVLRLNLASDEVG